MHKQGEQQTEVSPHIPSSHFLKLINKEIQETFRELKQISLYFILKETYPAPTKKDTPKLNHHKISEYQGQREPNTLQREYERHTNGCTSDGVRLLSSNTRSS